MESARKPRISSRVALWFAAAAFALEALAGGIYSAADGFTSGLSADPLKLLASGTAGANLVRWGSLIDMFGYLAIAPVVLYLHSRYSEARYVDLSAVAGLALVVIGAIGAAMMATAAPPLIRDYITATGAQRQAMLPAFATLYHAVVPGLWQTLETIPATVWLLGSAAAARRDGPRAVFVVLLGLGAVTAALALFRLLAG